jgi:hypothetical protein
MAEIFISYATDDRPTVRLLADALEARGWSVWWDHRNLRGGQHFHHIIEKEISAATVVIAVWSTKSAESRWVRDEATLALEQDKLMPLRIDMTHPPLGFRSIHTIDFSSWTGETNAEPFERLVKDLGHYLCPPTLSDRSDHPVPPTEPALQTADSSDEDQQPAGPMPIAEHSQASPSDASSPPSTATTQPTSTTSPPQRVVRKRVGKYFAAVAVTVGVVWGMVALEERQLPLVKPPTEASPPDSTGDAAAAQAAYDRGDYTTALNLARPAAEHGDPVAQYIFGLLYDNGQGLPQDSAEAARWYRKAADQGHAAAQYKVGVLYEFGLGVAQDYAEAARWYRRAADQGYADAQYNLGLLYKNGQGLPQDRTQAQAWMQKAAAADHERAKKWLEKN